MAVKTITANLNVVPVGIENTKAKFQELLKSANISPAIRLDIDKVLSKIDEIAPRIQGQLSGKGALNIDRMGFGKLDELIFKVAKNISKELGVAFDTTKVDEYAKKIKDIDSLINSNETKLDLKQKDIEKSKGKITEASQGLAPGMRGPDAEVKVKQRILEIEKQMADTVNTKTKKYEKMKNELRDLNKFITANKTVFEKLTKLQQEEIDLNKEKVALAGELNNLTIAQQQATSQAISEIPEVVKANEAVKEYTNAKSQLIKATMDQAQANADTAQSELDVDVTQKKSKKSLLEKIFALFTFQKAMQFVNRTVRDAVKTIKDLDKAITDMALVTTLSREEAWKLVGAMQNLATETGLATSQIAGVVVQFIRQGRSIRDAFELAEVAAKSAKVAGIDASEAVDYLTAAVNGFGLAASGAEAIADKFAAIAAKSASSFEELALAMSKVAPTAKSAGVSVDFMMGVIAKGIETTREAPENIGTAFKTIFARMREVTDLGKAMEDGMDLNRVEKALLSVDVPLRNTAGQFRNLEDVLIDVGRKWENLTSVEQAYLATALAGSRQQPRLLAIFNDFERTEELIAVSAGAAGELEDQHLEYMEGLEAALVRMKNAWEQVVTAFMSSEVIITIVNFLSAGFSTIADVIGGIGSPIQITTVALVGLTAALGLYTVAKYKAMAAEKAANAIGAMTSSQLIKQNMLTWAYAGSNVALANQLTATNASMLQVLGTTIALTLEKTRLALATSVGVQAQIVEMAVTGANKLGLLQLLKLKLKQISVGGIYLALTKKQNFFSGLEIVVDSKKTLTKKALIALNIKEIALKGKNLILGTLDLVLTFALTAAKLLLAAALYILSGAWIAALAPLLPFILAGAAVVALIYLLVLGFNELNKDVSAYGKNIAKANSQMRELENREKNVKKLTERFDELNNKVEKSAEDLDEMKSITEELGEVKVGNQTFNLMTEDAFGNAIVDEKEYNKYLQASKKEREKLLAEEQKEFNRAVRRFGVDAFDNDAISNSARRMGYRMVESLVEGIEDADLQKQVDNAVKASLAKVDMSVFVNARGQFDNKALEDFTQQQVGIFQNLFTDIETLSAVEGNAIENGTDAVTARVDAIDSSIQAYKDALAEIEASDLTDEQKAELEMALELTFSGEAGLLELIEQRSIDVELVAELSLRGMNNNQIAAFINSQLAPATEMAQEEAFEGITGFESTDPAAERARLQAERDELAENNWFGVNNTQIDTIDEQLEQLDEIEEDVNERRDELESTGRDLLRNIFTDEGGTLGQDMVAYKQYLMDTLELSEEEADAMMSSIYNALGVDTSKDIAAGINKTKSDREALYNLQKDVAEGNFESLTALAQEYGAEAVQAFMSGDPEEMEGFFATQKEKTIENINASIEALEALAQTQELTEAEEAELLALRTMLTYYEEMSAADQERTYWLGKSKQLMSEMNDLLKIAGDLMTLGLGEDHPLVAMLNSLAEAKYDSAIEAYEAQLENEFDALSEFGTFDETGAFTFFEDADMVAGQAALDGYLEVLGDYTNTLVAEYNRQADIIKKRYQGEIDAMKEAHSERWKEIEYLDKVQELEKKIIDARRQLMAFSLDSSMAGQMTDSLESLQKIQQERQKMIEQQMMEQAQKELETERDDALIALGQQQITAMEDLIESLNTLNGTILVTPRGTLRDGPPTGGSTDNNFLGDNTLGVY
jgi:TP901 family phage tail tape measure protein